MSSSSRDDDDRPKAIGLRFVPPDEDDDTAVSLGDSPAVLRNEIDRLLNVLASGEYQARSQEDREAPEGPFVDEMVMDCLQASGRFRAHGDVPEALIHQARTAADSSEDLELLETLADASEKALAAGKASEEAGQLREILTQSTEIVAREKRSNDSTLDDLYLSFLRESVSLLETKGDDDES